MKDALERDTPPLEVIERARAAIEKGAGYELGSTSEEVISRMARGLAWLWLQFNVNAEPTTIDDECRRAARIDDERCNTIHKQQAEISALRMEINEAIEHHDVTEMGHEASEQSLRDRITLLEAERDDARRQSNVDLEVRRAAVAEQSDNEALRRRIIVIERDRDAADAAMVGSERERNKLEEERDDARVRLAGATIHIATLEKERDEMVKELVRGANPDALLHAIAARPEPKVDEDDSAEDEREPDAPPRSEFVDRVIQATAEILADLLLEQEGRNT